MVPGSASAGHPQTPRRVLFFDGGSRGNPGPGGAGVAIIQVDDDVSRAVIIWSACMSYAQADMTNNRAEYLGLIAGLRAAQADRWPVEVVGDNALVLRQVQLYRPPRNAHLLRLYAEARKLGDCLGVTAWYHHLRAYNKMADQAANHAWTHALACKAITLTPAATTPSWTSTSSPTSTNGNRATLSTIICGSKQGR